MRCVILGAGGMGSAAARAAAALDGVSHLTIADLNENAAAYLAGFCGPKAHATRIDVSDRDALLTLLEPADAVLNLVGPFFRFGVPVLEAAIATGTAYFDICDDPEPTLEMLALDEKAKAAAIPAIVGLGASPGLTNLLAVKAHGALDTVDELITGWNLEDGAAENDGLINSTGTGSARNSQPNPSAAVIHWMEQCSGTVQAWIGGKQTAIRPVDPERVHYPGIGQRTLWTVGHPEALTLPRHFPDLKRSLNLMVMPRLLAYRLRGLRDRMDRGSLTLEEAGRLIVADLAKSGGKPSWLERAFAQFEGPAFPALFALARGRKDGHHRTVAAHLTALPKEGMAGVTGIPLAVGLGLFSRDVIAAPGVMAPEMAFDPDVFFESLAPYCEGVEEGQAILQVSVD